MKNIIDAEGTEIKRLAPPDKPISEFERYRQRMLQEEREGKCVICRPPPRPKPPRCPSWRRWE